jgi:hypothetical protein
LSHSRPQQRKRTSGWRKLPIEFLKVNTHKVCNGRLNLIAARSAFPARRERRANHCLIVSRQLSVEFH